MQFLENSSIWPSFTRTGHPLFPKTRVTFERGEGATLFDVEGKRYFDAFSTLWTNLVGHGRNEIIEAMSSQGKRLPFMHLFSGSDHKPAIDLAGRLTKLSPYAHSRVLFGCSGSDATDTSMKIARAFWQAKGHHQKRIIVARKSTYHGVTYGALSLMGHESYQTPFLPLVDDTHRVDPTDYQALETYFSTVNARERVAALLIEPVITSDGLIVADEIYWNRVARLCESHNVLLISDEVSTGMGRTGKLFGSTLYPALQPDILYLAKSLTSGYAPLSAVMTSTEIYNTLQSGQHFLPHGSTFAGHPLSCVAALKVLEIVERENLVEAATRIGNVMREEFDRLLKIDLPWTLQINGVGTLYEIILTPRDNANQDNVTLGMRINESLLNKGQYVRVLGNDLCFAPPLISTEEQIREMGTALALTLKEVAGKVV